MDEISLSKGGRYFYLVERAHETVFNHYYFSFLFVYVGDV